MIEKVVYIHDTARMLEQIEIEIWEREGKLLYNKSNMPHFENFEMNAESSLSEEEFEKKLADIKIEEWDKHIQPPEDVVYDDGTNWAVTVKYVGKDEIKKTGENAYPSNWNKFIKLMKLTVGKFETIAF
jgi:hypothetical protein